MFFLFLSCQSSVSDPTLETLPELPTKREESMPSRGNETPLKEAVITLVGEVRGEIEPCGCPTLPFGGFERRNTFVESLPKTHPIFQLDAGELLLKGFSEQSRSNVEDRAELLLRLSSEVGVDAMTVGPTDISALGIEKLLSFQEFPLISASFTNPDGSSIFPPFVVLEKDDFRLGVIGLSERPTDPRYRDSIQYIEPEDAVRKTQSQLPKNLDLVVALGSIDDEKAQNLSQKDLGLAAILSTRGSTYEQPYVPSMGTSLIIETPERGRYVQTMNLRINTHAQYALALTELEPLWRDKITPSITMSANAKSKIAKEGRGRNIVYIELHPLNEAYDEQKKSRVGDSLEEYKKDVLKKAAQNAKKEPEDEDVGYASSSNCAGCHSREFARWTFTDHAQAWQSLILKNEQKNPECIPCHTTGFGEPGGLGELNTTNIRKYKSVQCESCHGPLKGHPESKSVKSKPITPKSCTVC
ncbi:MAG: multiheme c-type cytochrome, partial [Myxococcota bacterium]|nr:multiheme c-type cytochrome [Myxococcota bacterium]